MKKRNKTNKKLPRYWIGTRKPTSIGYQPALGSGAASSSSTPGIENSSTLLKTAERNYLPGLVNRTLLNVNYPLLMLLNTTRVPVYLGSSSAPQIALSIASSPTIGNVATASMAPIGNLGTQFGTGTTSHATSVFSDAVGSAIEPTATTVGETAATGAANTTTKTVLNSAGKALGVAGGLYGLGRVVGDLSEGNDYRDASQMKSTLTTTKNTTPGGNQYTTYSGLDVASERRLENLNKARKQVNLALDLMGMGSSFGGVIGGVPGLIIGGIGGALLGGLGSILGYGDNSEEQEALFKMLQDSLGMLNRQALASAINRDTKQEFYERGAKYGKSAGFGPNGYEYGKQNSWIAPHEEVYNRNQQVGAEVPGTGHEDTVPSTISPHDDNDVFSNAINIYNPINGKIQTPAKMVKPYIESTNKMSEIQASVDRSTKQGELNWLMAQRVKDNNDKYIDLARELQGATDDMKQNKAKCGKSSKLPKFWDGNVADYAALVIPRLGEAFNALSNLREDRAADINVPTMNIEQANPYFFKAYNLVMNNMVDERPYMNDLWNTYKQNAWNMRRNPGYGIGARMVGLDSLYKRMLNAQAQTRMNIEKLNRDQVNDGANMLNAYGSDLLNKNYDLFWRRFGYLQQANAAKFKNTREDKNLLTKVLLKGAGDIMAQRSLDEAKALQREQMDMYGRRATVDELRLINDLGLLSPLHKELLLKQSGLA